MASIDHAWAAGFFDGEGSTVTLQGKRKRDYLYLRVSIGQKDRELLDRFARAVGTGKVYGPIRQRTTGINGKLYESIKFHYSADNAAACEVIRQIGPYLGGAKRAQAKSAVYTYNVSLAERRPYANKPRHEEVNL